MNLQTRMAELAVTPEEINYATSYFQGQPKDWISNE